MRIVISNHQSPPIKVTNKFISSRYIKVIVWVIFYLNFFQLKLSCNNQDDKLFFYFIKFVYLFSGTLGLIWSIVQDGLSNRGKQYNNNLSWGRI